MTAGAQRALGLGSVDIANNALVIHGGSISQINGQAATGYAGGAWNGPGIDSSTAAGDTTHLTAVGVATGITEPDFYGASVTATDVLVAYTQYGDTNLDGTITVADYAAIDNGSAHHLTGWQNGDFNYDGTVNYEDYALIDAASATFEPGPLARSEISAHTAEFGSAYVAALSALDPSAVPEPACISVLGIAIAGLLGRRRAQRMR
jgi:hypothetical protein